MISRNRRKSLNIRLSSASPRLPRTSRNVARPVPNPYHPGMKWRFCVQANTQGMARRSASVRMPVRRAGREPMFRSAISSTGLAASVLEHSLKSERAQALVPTTEFDEAMEALSGPAHAAYRRPVEHPRLVDYFQAASPVEEIALLNIGSPPARRTGIRTLRDLGAIPWVFAWTQNRHFIPGW